MNNITKLVTAFFFVVPVIFLFTIIAGLYQKWMHTNYRYFVTGDKANELSSGQSIFMCFAIGFPMITGAYSMLIHATSLEFFASLHDTQLLGNNIPDETSLFVAWHGQLSLFTIIFSLIVFSMAFISRKYDLRFLRDFFYAT
ncbi:MAG: hypothetical protein ABW168_05515 [Sedimenticola sp.]